MLAGAAGADNVLHVGLDEEGAVEEAEDVGPFEGRLVILDADGGIDELSLALAVAEVAAEFAKDDAECGDVAGAVWIEAAGGDAGGEEVRHLADVLVGRDHDGRNDTEAASDSFIR